MLFLAFLILVRDDTVGEKCALNNVSQDEAHATQRLVLVFLHSTYTGLRCLTGP